MSDGSGALASDWRQAAKVTHFLFVMSEEVLSFQTVNTGVKSLNTCFRYTVEEKENQKLPGKQKVTESRMFLKSHTRLVVRSAYVTATHSFHTVYLCSIKLCVLLFPTLQGGHDSSTVHVSIVDYSDDVM